MMFNFFWMPKMKNVAKNEIVLHHPYSNALWGVAKFMLKNCRNVIA